MGVAKSAARCLNWICSLAQVVLAVFIIVLVTMKLTDVDAGNFTWTCSLGANTASGTLCNYVYAVAGVSILVSTAISLVQCCTCHLCGLGGLLDLIFAVGGCIWWAVASSVVTKGVVAANDSVYSVSSDIETWRTTVMGLCWGEVALFGLMVLTGIATCC